MLLEIDTNVYVNPDQVQVVRPATRFESLDRDCPCVAIIMQNDVRYYIKGYVPDIMRKLKPDSNEKGWQAR
jgi:hypothetical protein